MDESMRKNLTDKQIQDIKLEIADVAIYLFRLTDVLGVDLADAMREKMKINESRF